MNLGNFRRKYLYRDSRGRNMCDKTSPITEFFFRFDSYAKIAIHSINCGIPFVDLVRARFPFKLPDPKKPTMVLLELVNSCNLKCIYCPIPRDGRAKGAMSRDTFDNVLRQLREIHVNRVHVRGWGEPTLHPHFGDFMQELTRTVKFVDVVTNGHWRDRHTTEDFLNAGVHRIDISIDVGGSNNYENVRIRGRYGRVLENVISLQKERDRRQSNSMIIVRAMFRPSQERLLEKERVFWRQYADTVMPAPILRLYDDEDLSFVNNGTYTLTATEKVFPRCYFPFNELTISWDGDIPLCDNLVLRLDPSVISTGNVNNASLCDIWNGQRFAQLRNGHRYEVDQDRWLCKDCPTC